jgi:hypothetical protein
MWGKMKTPIIATNDAGNGTIIEIARLIPKDIPSHTIWLTINRLLLELTLIASPLFEMFN